MSTADIDRYFNGNDYALQHIAFPIEVFDEMEPEEKVKMFSAVVKDNWKQSLRGLGWLIMSRVKSGPIVWDENRSLYGVKGVREFSEDELREFYYRLRDRVELYGDVGLSDSELLLKRPFDIFARDNNYDRHAYFNVLKLLRKLASEGIEVQISDFKKPPFNKVGNPIALFGQKINKVIEFQNKCARDIRGQEKSDASPSE